ncbi:hypothetical protein T03_8134 [Trichinella britovi]|uniref:Uncharacterized protein n=1 Tax=Trichinella britovi TaxID=45882 RepID=A0A0V1D2B2_TRIBR|nr:hypothetical protein T03_8134 [Trichinella britovi]
MRCIAEDFIENQTDEKKVKTVKNGSDTSVTICLPRYELPKFHGDVLEFTAFCEQFEDSMHSHQDISDSTKFSHLLCLSNPATVLNRLFWSQTPSDDVMLHEKAVGSRTVRENFC